MELSTTEKQIYAEITALRTFLSALLVSDTMQLSNKNKEVAIQKIKELGDCLKKIITDANESREDKSYGDSIVSAMDKIIDGAINGVNNTVV